MIARLKKEVRGQFAALGLVALTACLVAFRTAFIGGGEDALRPTFFLEVSPFLLIAAICMAASAFYTSEFHWRTLQLLLAQPVSRARIWTEKFATIIACVALFGIAFAMLNAFAGARISPETEMVMWRYSLEHMRSGSLGLWWLAIMVTVVSSPFWSLIARTLIGAVALNMASQALGLLLLNAAFQHFQPGTRLFVTGEQPWGLMPVLWVAALAYSAVLAWLGWRKFKSLELADGAGDVVVSGRVEDFLSAAAGKRIFASLSRTNPLMAKELRLHRPTLLLGGLLVVLWFAAVAVRWVFPGTNEDVEIFLAVAVGTYVPLVVLLSASISLGEESRIGIYEWHLTFPIARWRVWILKLAVAFGVAAIRGVLLPMLLGIVTLPEFRQEMSQIVTGEKAAEALPLFLILGTLFLVGFWSAVYLRDAIRSIIGTLLVIVLGSSAIVYASWAVESSEVQQRLVSWYIAWQQLTSYTAMNHIGRFAVVLVCLGFPGLLLWLSLRAMRRNAHGLRTFVRVAALVLLSLLLLALWIGDLIRSIPAAHTLFMGELRSAIQRLPAGPHDKNGARELTVEELERTGPLSPVTRYWLRNCKLTLAPQGGGLRAAAFVLGIKFPAPRFSPISYGEGVIVAPPFYLWPTNRINTGHEEQFIRRYGVSPTPR